MNIKDQLKDKEIKRELDKIRDKIEKIKEITEDMRTV